MSTAIEKIKERGLPHDIRDVLPAEVRDTLRRVDDFYQNLHNLKTKEGQAAGSSGIIDVQHEKPLLIPAKIRELANLSGVFIDPTELLVILLYHTSEGVQGDRIELNFMGVPGKDGLPKDSISQIKLRVASEFQKNDKLITEVSCFDYIKRNMAGFKNVPPTHKLGANSNWMTAQIRTDAIVETLSDPKHANFQLGFLEEVIGILNEQAGRLPSPSGRVRVR